MSGSPYRALVSGFLFPLQERFKGHETVALRRTMEDSQWWPRDRLQALQARRLQELLSDVAATVPFYRDHFRQAGITPQAISTLDDLERLPITNKPLIRGQGDAWLAARRGDVVAQQTSGSSGEPLHFYLSKRRISFDIAAKWRATRWWDVDFGDPEVVIWGSGIEGGAQNRLRSVRDRVFRSALVPADAFHEERLDEMIALIRRRRPRMLFGYPSALSRLARHAKRRGVAMDDLGIRVAFTTAEVLRPEWREIIAETFRCGVADEYGARDAGFIARECPYGGFHVTAEEVILEAVDDNGHPVPPGEPGDLLVTNLASAAFPFIRYRTGDRGILDPSPCSCGRGLPLLKEVVGRSNDGLVARDGAWIHGSAFNYLMREIGGLQSYKIVQRSLDEVTVYLVLDRELSEGMQSRLHGAFRQRLGDPIRIEVKRVRDIAPEANGKFRHIVCEVEGAA